jgi:hypothetical protein
MSDDIAHKDELLRRALDYLKQREGFDLVPERDELLADLRRELKVGTPRG